MIDYIKIINLLIGSEIKSLLNFEIKVIEKTGEAPPKKKFAYDKNMIFTLTPGDRFAKVGGSLHKFSNGGELNNDRFTFKKFRKVHEYLSRWISPDDSINILEFGVNINTPFDPTDFINCLISYKQTQFNKEINPGMAYAECSLSHFLIKIYNKGLQQPNGSNILRFEVRQERMQKLFPDSLKWSQLADLKTWEYLGEVLKEKFSDVIYYDHSIKLDQIPEKERQIIERGYNPVYWKNNKSPHAGRERKQFQDLIRKDGSKFNLLPDLISQEVAELVKSYHYSEEANKEPELSKMAKSYHYSQSEDLTPKGASFDPLAKSYPLLSCTFSPTGENRFCKVTGIDISMQKSGSKFLCISGLRFLNENDHPAFDKLRRKRLSAKWDNEPLEVQFRELAHSIRNEYFNPKNNPRNNTMKGIENLFSHPSLFDIRPFIRPEKMELAGMI